jgi:lipopolysaccharide export LptBFGC system permease protein LptF
MAVVALPFAFRLGRRGALYGIGIALALGIVFYAVIAIFRTLGEAGVLPTEVAAWGPSVLFATGSMYLFLGVRT